LVAIPLKDVASADEIQRGNEGEDAKNQSTPQASRSNEIPLYSPSDAAGRRGSSFSNTTGTTTAALSDAGPKEQKNRQPTKHRRET